MAIYHLSVKYVQRSQGRSAPAAAAYRSGERLKDERQGLTHDYRRRDGVAHTEIVTPTGEAIERGTLWNLAEAAERRKDGVTAREYEIALPAELTREQRLDLTREFAKHVAKAQGCAVDIAIHEPREGDGRNHHAHLLCTTREFLDGALGGKCKYELAERDRKKLGLSSRKAEFEKIREAWANLGNEALTRAGHVGDLDHRSNEARGIEALPGVHLGPTAAAMERRQVRTERGDINRAVSEQRGVAAELAAEENVDKKLGDLKANSRNVFAQMRKADAAKNEAKEQRDREAAAQQKAREEQKLPEPQKAREEERQRMRGGRGGGRSL